MKKNLKKYVALALFIVSAAVSGALIIHNFTNWELSYRASIGDIASQMALGEIYRRGKESDRDLSKAIELYEEAAKSGNALSMAILGDIYRNDLTPPDYTKSTKWYQRSFDSGVKEAGFLLGLAYKEGLGVTQDYSIAAKYFSDAKNFSPAAQYELAFLYKDGRGVPVDGKEYIRLLTSSANSDYGFAHVSLAQHLVQRNQSPDDISQAVVHLEKAENLRNWQASYMLGEIYLDGKFVPQDFLRAGRHIFIASKLGSVEAKKFLDRKIASCFADKSVNKKQTKNCMIVQGARSAGYVPERRFRIN